MCSAPRAASAASPSRIVGRANSRYPVAKSNSGRRAAQTRRRQLEFGDRLGIPAPMAAQQHCGPAHRYPSRETIRTKLTAAMMLPDLRRSAAAAARRPRSRCAVWRHAGGVPPRSASGGSCRPRDRVLRPQAQPRDPQRSDRARERGIVTVVVLVGGAAALGLVIDRACRGSLARGRRRMPADRDPDRAAQPPRPCRRGRGGARRAADCRPAATPCGTSSAATRRASTHSGWRAPRSRASPRISATGSSRRCSGTCFRASRPFRLQDGEHPRQHDRASHAALPKLRLGGRPPRRCPEPRAGAGSAGCLLIAAAVFAGTAGRAGRS